MLLCGARARLGSHVLLQLEAHRSLASQPLLLPTCTQARHLGSSVGSVASRLGGQRQARVAVLCRLRHRLRRRRR